MELVYLACPYTHKDKAVMEERFHAVNKVAATLIQEGRYVFSPISQSHPISQAGALPTNWDYWHAYDRLILSCCSTLVVLMLDGWHLSTGVQAEIAIAKELGLYIEYLLPEG